MSSQRLHVVISRHHTANCFLLQKTPVIKRCRSITLALCCGTDWLHLDDAELILKVRLGNVLLMFLVSRKFLNR